ncbi:MAG: hypothetical protein NTY47_08770 [Candidatus Omnitrophica bacterium]|nr:hypothetical protein [Candidatus Omnitrophota bacterium]
MLRQALTYAEDQIADINKMTQGKDLSEAVTKFNKDLARAAAKLPLRQEVVLNYLSDNARRFNIDVKNMVLADKQIVKDIIPGLEIDEIPVSMTLTGDFRSLGDYLNLLTNDESVLTILKKIDIIGGGEGRTKLDISLKVSAYLAKEAAAGN